MLGHVRSVNVSERSEGFIELLELEAAGWDGVSVGQRKKRQKDGEEVHFAVVKFE